MRCQRFNNSSNDHKIKCLGKEKIHAEGKEAQTVTTVTTVARTCSRRQVSQPSLVVLACLLQQSVGLVEGAALRVGNPRSVALLTAC